MTDELTNTLDELETEVMETLENPYSTYSAQFPYTVSFTIPDDDYQTSITIKSRSETLRYGRDEHDIHHQMELDQAQGKHIYAKHLLNWVGERLWNINPKEVTVTYGDDHTIEMMTDEEINDFREDCLNNV